MTGWLRAMLRELRHGTCLLAFVAMAALVGVLLWSKGPDWGTRWNELGAAVRDYMILLVPAALMLGVWHGGRARRSEVDELMASTRRAALWRQSSEIAALALAAYLGLLVGVASAAWSILVVGGYGTWAAVAYLVAALPTIAAYIAVGYLIGRAVAWRIVAPVAGVLAYLILGFWLWNSDKLAVLMGAGWLGGTDTFAFDTEGWGWTLVFAAIAALAVTALASAERRPARSLTWSVLAVGGLVLVGLTVQPALAATNAGSRHFPQVTHPALACTADAPKVCVLKADQHLLPETTRQARRALAELSGLDGAPTWARPPLPDGTSPGFLQVQPGHTTPWGKPDRRYGNQSFVDVYSVFDPDGCSSDAASGIASAGVDSVVLWLTYGDRSSTEIFDSLDASETSHTAILRRFLASSSDERRTYLTRLIHAGQTCDPVAIRKAVDALAATE